LRPLIQKIQWHRNAHISPRKEKEEISTVSVNACLLPTGAEWLEHAEEKAERN
jgi:hypothetical protein